mgnify:FL=1
MRLTWPLVGRAEQMRRIDAALSAADVCGVVVSGPPGVGKSRIVREALTAAESRGFTTRLAVGTSSARAVPLGAFTAWTQPDVSDVAQLLRGVITALSEPSPGATVVVAVDDMHLLDDLSTFVVHQIAQRGLAKLILTVRDGEPISPAVAEVWRSGHFDRLHVRPLAAADATALLAAILDGPIDPDAAQRLWKLTCGNPLYLCNIVEHELADGRVERTESHWRWTGDPVMPPGLVELIETRVGALPGPVADVLDTLAVAEPVELAMLTRITDAGAIEQAESCGLVTVAQTGTGVQVRVAHPIYGEVRRNRAPATKLRRLRGLVAGQLASAADCDDLPVLVRRASLVLDSDLQPDVGMLTRAAHGAVWLADLGLAERLAQAAIRAGAGPQSHFVRAHALSWLGRGADADEVLAGIDPARLTDAERARWVFLRASNALWALGDPARAKAFVDGAESTIPLADRNYIDAFRTVFCFATDEPAAAIRAAQDLRVDDMPAVVGAEIAWALATIDADAGRMDAAVRTAEAGYRAADRSLDAPHMRFNIADAHVSALVLAGRSRDARGVADRVRLLGTELPGAAQLLGSAVAGRAALAAGDLESACELLDHAAVGLCARHALGWGFRYQIPRATALAMRGRTDEAAAALATLDTMPRPFRALDYERCLAQAWVAAAQGAVSEAIAVVASAAERARADGRFAAEVHCLQTATQFGDQGCAPRLTELTTIVEGPRVGLASRFARALRDGDAVELDAVSVDFEAMGDPLAAIDAAALAALAYRGKDLKGSALSSRTRADALAARCGEADTPALRRASEPLPLTAREYEIARLVGENLLNREIAERLGLSVRTVESHIFRAMAKTGAASREQLAALLAAPSRGRSPQPRPPQ